jgi:tRNA pseudouridine55 synthase
MNGVLIIDKPSGLTSHDVVNRVRRILGQRSIGHLGTLDPMATGILPLVTGNFTRLAQFYMNSEKSYEGVIRFGLPTDTYDAEGDPTADPKPVTFHKDQLEEAATKFRGVIEQTPPPFSAKKIQGVPAYKLARKQKEVTLMPVQIEIKEFEILSFDTDRARFRARVASGTYMRSIAHDLGQLLGCGAHLESLRRTQVCEFTLADAHTLEDLAEAAGQSSIQQGTAVEERPFDGPVDNDAEQRFCHPEARVFGEPKDLCNPSPTTAAANPLLDLFIHPRKLLPQMPSVTADDATAARIRSGRTVNLPDLSRALQVKVFIGQRDLIAIATRVAGTLFHPKIVLCGS